MLRPVTRMAASAWPLLFLLCTAVPACRSKPSDRGTDGAAPAASASTESKSEYWDDVFRSGQDFNTQPSAFLADTVKGVSPGDALDIGMGQGRNALYLASRGWHVTGIDISDEGLRLAREAAAAHHLPLQAIRADAETWDYGVDRWDLVALIFFGPDDQLVARIRAAVRHGGLVVLEHFHWGAFASDPHRGYADGELAARFADGFTVVRDDVVEDATDWGGAPGTRRLVERFVARRR